MPGENSREEKSFSNDVEEKSIIREDTNSRPAKRRRKIQRLPKSVRFAQEESELIISRPYCNDISDAETLRSCHANIWYSPCEYLSFMRDRLDTIRVYNSVKGQMRYGLADHYCTRGLEHLLDAEQHSQSRIAHKALKDTILKGHERGDDPETLGSIMAAGSAMASKEALRRASSQDNSVPVDSGYDSADDSADESEASIEGQKMKAFNLNSIMLGNRTLSIDLPSLRSMNLQLVEQMRNTSPVGVSFSCSSDCSSADITRLLLRSALSNATFKPAGQAHDLPDAERRR